MQNSNWTQGGEHNEGTTSETYTGFHLHNTNLIDEIMHVVDGPQQVHA